MNKLTPRIKKGMVISLFLLASHSAFAQNPQIVAHRAGTADAPENTLYAINLAKDNKANAIWLTVQLSKDDQLVLYRPSDLDALTNKKGPISNYSAEQLSQISAAHQFNQKNNLQLPAQETTITTLETILKKYPDTPFYIDLKSPDADPDIQAKAIFSLLNKTNAFNQVRFYSTNNDFIKALPKISAKINTFESRDDTRTLLANSVMNHQCPVAAEQSTTQDTQSVRWYGFELHRKVEVVEKYTLGEARSPATLSWDKEAVDCFRKTGNAYIILFGVNNASDYQLAKEIGADAVMVDSPKAFKQ
ncbi:MAG TPA: glycerophosphodiester phosphodiesterase [Providencia sp.]|uniref:glycerophosphodiester phosphodiesterase family protein n=1 Tax=Providencia sp. TaxID=589 RepID=UPI000E82DD09|nr:glycerophosphodiester phosphodiesterase family protein [Providencia sp.]MBP6082774.1 glycerophosphodiester phosphodiesterase [Providencia sp.]HBO24419.1 glycerophosphodiester phosphodiesterase [Providencia sp.]